MSRIAVVGFGMGGSALAWRLAEAGHDVVVFEQAPSTGPVGAGILLQPNGQAVLDHFGVLDDVEAMGARITGLDARHRSGRALTTIDYAMAGSTRHAGPLNGIGVMRSDLFDLFSRRCDAAGVDVHTGHRVVGYRQDDTSVRPLDAAGEELGSFDLVVAADGSNSSLRSHAVSTNGALKANVREYVYGAMWMAAPYEGDQARLVQVVDRSGRLVGMLPVGNERCSFFWGIRLDEQAEITAGGLARWQRQVTDFLPEAGVVAASMVSLDDATFSTYRTVRMARPVDGRVVFVGDAAHATSPHLGQGLNLALVDAAVLAEALAEHDDHRVAFDSYVDRRRATTRFYTQMTGFLTPFFQTSNPVLRGMRDVALPVMPRVPGLRAHMALTMSGLKRSWFSPIRPTAGVRGARSHWRPAARGLPGAHRS